EVNYPNINEFSKNNLLAMEKEMTGMYLTGHPLDEYVQSLKMYTSISIDKIYKSQQAHLEGVDDDEYSIHDEDKVIIGGIISEANQKVTRSNTIMAFIKLEDLSGSIEVIVFPKTLDKVRPLITQDSMVVIKGRVSMKEDEPVKIICETIEPLEKVNSSKLFIRVENLMKAKQTKHNLMNITSQY
ncbi:DNA polymerase III subunit alpha, partial [Clostridium saudiense]|nr:DNA polymerase III subunit alpha [Clostridium saudiense]